MSFLLVPMRMGGHLRDWGGEAVSSAKCPQCKGHRYKALSSGVSITGDSPSPLSPKKFSKVKLEKMVEEKIWLAGSTMLRDNREKESQFLFGLWISVKHRDS